MNGEYITELEALQVVCEGVVNGEEILNGSKKFKMANGGDFDEYDGYDITYIGEDIESLFRRFGFPVKITGTRFSDYGNGCINDVQCYFQFDREIMIPILYTSDWQRFGGMPDSPPMVSVTDGAMFIEVDMNWRKKPTPFVFYPTLTINTREENGMGATKYFGDIPDGQKGVSGEAAYMYIANTVKKACAYLKSITDTNGR